ncbi:MAG: YbjN domain-containing protein [Planctomycetaceae bacterium]
MPINLERLEAMFVEAGLKYRLEDAGHLLTGFATTSYENEDGRRGVAVAVTVSEDGEFLECTAPRLYDARRSRDPGRLFQALLDITMRTKLVRFEHDPEDGEIRCTVCYPIEDGGLTARQFLRMLQAIPKAVDRWNPVIRLAIEEGIVDLSAGMHEAATKRPEKT